MSVLELGSEFRAYREGWLLPIRVGIAADVRPVKIRNLIEEGGCNFFGLIYLNLPYFSRPQKRGPTRREIMIDSGLRGSIVKKFGGFMSARRLKIFFSRI